MTYPSPYPPPYGDPYPGYPPQPPKTNLVWGILTTLLCFWPLGVVSIVYASKVNGLWFQGRYEEALAASNKARNWAIWSAVAFVALMVVAIAILVATDPTLS
jgi:Interferon-induced transmembrane protein